MSTAVLAGALPAAAAPAWSVRGTPGWVAPVEVPPAPDVTTDVREGTDFLLVDQQVRVSARSEERYFRQVRRILSPSGVQAASELSIDFDPSYERLVFHHVRLVRGGAVKDAFVPAEIKVIQRETGLGEGIYDGTLTAIAFLKDVRPGDVIDHAYTLEGANPLLAGRFATVLEMGYGVPARRLHQRILWPASRPLYLRPHRTEATPKVLGEGGVRSYTWDLRDVPATDEDDQAPAWYDPYPWVQVSDFASWAEVNEWARALFDAARKGAAGLEEVAARIRGEQPSEEGRALAAIRFVQDEVRYLGLEMGPGSHQPQPPSRVLAQRYGDCKDKALLLVALLGDLGIDADPVLVHTSAGATLDEWQPSPFAFDHAIVRAVVGGQVLWIDATLSGQGGGLGELLAPPYPRALVLRPETTGLAAFPSASSLAPTTVVAETYTVREGESRLEVKTTYSREDAEAIRDTLATTPVADLGKAYLNHYAQDSLRVEAIGLPRFHDDRARNVVVVEETYRLPGFWTGEEKTFSPWAVQDQLQKPTAPRRSAPLAVEHPVHVRHTILIRLPRAAAIAAEDFTVEDPAFRFRSVVRTSGDDVTLTYDYASLADHVPLAGLETYLGRLEDARRHLSHGIDPRASRRGLATSRVAAGALALLASLLAAVWLAGRRRAQRAATRAGSPEPPLA